MLETLAALGVTLTGGALAGVLASDHAPDDTETTDGDAPESALSDIPDTAPASFVLPEISQTGARFDTFDPEHDQVVGVFPDAMETADIFDLIFDYDEARDETHVTLDAPDGLHAVCCLAEVAPGEMDAGNFDVMPQSEARATPGPLCGTGADRL